MARQARKEYSTGIFHVMMRGINHQNIFEEPEDSKRIEGQRRLAQTTGKIDRCWAWADTETVMSLTCPCGSVAVPDRRFMITEIGNNRQGWMPRRFWNFIRDNED